MSVSKIVVGVDGSGGGRHALGWAASLASGLGAEVVVVLAYDPMTQLMGTAERMDFDELRADAEARVQGEWCEPLVAAGVAHRAMLVEGDEPHEVLIGAATTEGADLIVIGNVGLTGWRDRIIGSVAARVLKHSPLPVTVVPQPRPAD